MTDCLLCTLGISWAVVPEAFLLGAPATGGFGQVRVLTSSGPAAAQAAAQVSSWFARYHPAVDLQIHSIRDFTDVRDLADHRRFEEALYRIAFDRLRAEARLHVCLAGGFKTMSSAAHEVAGHIGCESLFHIIADPGTQTSNHQEMLDSIAAGAIRIVPLGPRAAWPTLLGLADLTPPLDPPPYLDITDTRVTDAVQERIQAASRLAASERDTARLPFASLARWSPASRAALDAPLDPERDASWLLALPKVDLHCHLGGFATGGEDLAAVRQSASHPESLAPPSSPSLPTGWPLPAAAIGLETYRKLGDAGGSTILRDPGCLRRHIQLLYQHFLSQNILHAEVRCSPANYAGAGRSAWDVLAEIRQHFADCRQQVAASHPRPPSIDLLVIATREDAGDFRTRIARHLALAATAFEHWTDESMPRIVGVDLAGFENRETRAHYFRDDFMAALRLGMGITVHAGENDDAEGIWSAILDLNARRLGHALHLASSPSLLRTAADRRIGIEMCPYANLQIHGYPLDPPASLPASARYPLLEYLRAGVPVTVNTDNIGISAASLTGNFLLLPRLCPGITRLDVLQLLHNAIHQAFLPAHRRLELLAAAAIPPPA